MSTGDRLTFNWIHSFEHTPWNEYYEIREDSQFTLHTISIAGFGAGIPAEMDCKITYKDGLIYMEEIESVFPEFNFIHSQTALQAILLNGEVLIRGSDMPQYEKINLLIQK